MQAYIARKAPDGVPLRVPDGATPDDYKSAIETADALNAEVAAQAAEMRGVVAKPTEAMTEAAGRIRSQAKARRASTRAPRSDGSSTRGPLR